MKLLKSSVFSLLVPFAISFNFPKYPWTYVQFQRNTVPLEGSAQPGDFFKMYMRVSGEHLLAQSSWSGPENLSLSLFSVFWVFS